MKFIILNSKYYFFILIGIFFINCCSNENNNPLLSTRDVPIEFSSITESHIKLGAEVAIKNANKILKKIYRVRPSNKTFENTLLPLDNLGNTIENVWSPVSLLAFTHPDVRIRDASFEASKNIEEYLNSLSIDEKLFNAIKIFSNNESGKSLSGLEKKYLLDTIREFNRSGFGQGEKVRTKVKLILDQLTSLGLRFEKHISESSDTLFLNDEQILGLSDEYKNQRRIEDNKYAIDLSYPSYDPFMKYAKSDSARKLLRFLYWNRASDKNIVLLDSLLFLRNQLAEILDYPTYADYSTELLMAQSANGVWEFERSIHELIMPVALKDYDKMLKIKSDISGKYETTIESWEYAQFEHLIKLEEFNLDSKQISEYFELNNVIEGIFDICNQLFNLEFIHIETPSVWHKDVMMYEVLDRDDKTLIGRFYLDLFPRPDKYSHAAAFSVTMGKLINDNYQIPATALVCNFPQPKNGFPSLLSHEDVETFFHEFGHLLHGILTVSPLYSYSGTSVLQDFVEAPSQIFENWVWEKEILKLFARHYKTGEIIPDKLVDKMVAAKNVNAGVNTLQQIFYGVYDFTLHDGFDPYGELNTTDMAEILQNELTLYPYLDGTHMQASFGHLVGYDASYYSYLWSKVYAQDMYMEFKRNGLLDKNTGMRFRSIILEPGGTVHPQILMQEFLGRKPNIQAYLSSLGIQ